MDEGIAVQMEDNLPSIEHTLRPIVFVSWFLGVGIARPPKCPKAVTIILRIIHFGLCSVAIDSFTSNQILNINCENYIYKIMYYMNKVMCYVSTHYYVYHGIEQYEKWPELMSKIKKLDRKIRRETPMNDLPIEVVEVLAILATFGPLFIIIYAYYYFIRPEDTVASELRLYYTIAQSLINNFIFDVIVYVLYHRFQTINKLIMQLDKQINAPQITSKIRCIRKLHN
ncbi:lysine exporter protein, partial [Lasius niger]